MFQRLPKGTVREDEQPINFTVTKGHLTHSEGDILELGGPSVDLEAQYFAASTDTPLLYTSTCFWLTGELLGKSVEGALFYDNAYFSHGREWKEYGYYNNLQITWNVFAKKFEDESYEWGHIVLGRDGFNPGGRRQPRADRGHDPGLPSASSPSTTRTGRCASTTTPRVRTITSPATRPDSCANSQRRDGRDTRAKIGMTRRADDDRQLADGFSWLEGFPDRAKEDGMIKAAVAGDRLPPR